MTISRIITGVAIALIATSSFAADANTHHRKHHKEPVGCVEHVKEDIDKTAHDVIGIKPEQEAAWTRLLESSKLPDIGELHVVPSGLSGLLDQENKTLELEQKFVEYHGARVKALKELLEVLDEGQRIRFEQFVIEH